jgi:hypothetical protein
MDENEPQKLLTGPEASADITSILKGVPEAEKNPDRKTPPINEDDFEPTEIIEETADESDGEEEDEEIEAVEAEEVRNEELSEKSKEIKKRFVKMMKPSRIIGFGDMILSRAGSAIMIKTDKKDWRLDKDEKEFLSDCLDVMIEEEGIEFWPAKVWLMLAVVFFFGMKGLDNYSKYYSSTGLLMNSHKDEHENYVHSHDKRMLEIQQDMLEAEYFEQKAKLAKRIRDAQHAIENDLDLPEKNGAIYTTGQTKVKPGIDPDYPPDKYYYKNGVLQLNQDGTPSLKPGPKEGTKVYQHPITKKFISKDAYFKIMNGQSIDDEEPEEVEAEEVE